MPVDMSNTDGKPPKGALFVAAGTVNMPNVDSMGSGFNMFKEVFGSPSAKNHKTDKQLQWEVDLNKTLADYKQPNGKIPAYIPGPTNADGTVGGIATVPIHGGMKPDKADGAPTEDEQYVKAVKEAITTAKKLGKPLFIQPLGIGMYGWTPEKAASLFHKAIKEADPNDEVNIQIPIYDQTANSKDQRFKKALASELKLAPQQQQPPAPPDAKVKTDGPDANLDLSTIVKAYEMEYEDCGHEGSPHRHKVDEAKNEVTLTFKNDAERDAFLQKLAEKGVKFKATLPSGEPLGQTKDGNFVQETKAAPSLEPAKEAANPISKLKFKEYKKLETLAKASELLSTGEDEEKKIAAETALTNYAKKVGLGDITAAQIQQGLKDISAPSDTTTKSHFISEDEQNLLQVAKDFPKKEGVSPPEIGESSEKGVEITFVNDAQRDDFAVHLASKGVEFKVQEGGKVIGKSGEDSNYLKEEETLQDETDDHTLSS